MAACNLESAPGLLRHFLGRSESKLLEFGNLLADYLGIKLFVPFEHKDAKLASAALVGHLHQDRLSPNYVASTAHRAEPPRLSWLVRQAGGR